MKSIFTISLDFELHWGGFEKWPLQIKTAIHRPPGYQPTHPTEYSQYFLNTRQVVPDMLALFGHYEVHVTWATVGLLMHSTRVELLANAPSRQPTYHTRELSAYHYMDHSGIGSDENSDPFHFAASLVAEILRVPHQELGTHTFAHYYCQEPGQTPEQFGDDLRAAQRAAKRFGVQLQSLVFPRNQFNQQYLRIAYQEGIRAVRSNPADWFWKIESTQHEPWLKRLARGMDAYVPIGKRSSYPLSSVRQLPDIPVCLPASRLLRPYRPQERLFSACRVTRIKQEMDRAVRDGSVYHVWWHPHNFARHPEQNLADLKTLLEHLSVCRRRGMVSLNMGETVHLLPYAHA